MVPDERWWQLCFGGRKVKMRWRISIYNTIKENLISNGFPSKGCDELSFSLAVVMVVVVVVDMILCNVTPAGCVTHTQLSPSPGELSTQLWLPPLNRERERGLNTFSFVWNVAVNFYIYIYFVIHYGQRKTEQNILILN